MVAILHRVGIEASPERVFEALSTIQGLRHWWVGEAMGEPGPGGLLDFGFCRMKVLEARPGEWVHWRCTVGPEEWVGTELTFQLKWAGNQTFLLFRHAHWKEPVEFMHHCSTKWATFLLSLRDWVERGAGHPTPHDIKIHVGD